MVRKRGQIKLSFGMIFSVILIIIFLVFAFYAIRTFFGIQESAQVGVFLDNLQSDINNIWQSTEGSRDRVYNLPGKISHVCFVDFDVPANPPGNSGVYGELEFYRFTNENLVFYPAGIVNPESVVIRNINLAEITQGENPFCIENDGGVKLTLVKNFGYPLVKIERQE